MATVVEEFAPTSIETASFQFIDKDGTQNAGEEFDCVASIEGETTLKVLTKKCRNMESGKVNKPEKMDLTLTGHIPVKIVRDIFGISSEDLVTGVYSYSQKSKDKEFVFTADQVDDFGNTTKLMAFPRCKTSKGFGFSLENNADEVANMELTFTVYPDKEKNLYYEGFMSEIEDEMVKGDWHSMFEPSLVGATPSL